MKTNFHRNLAANVHQNNIGGANRVIMTELGKVVVHHRPDFINLLKNSDAPVQADVADAELVNLFMDNIHKKEMLIGAAFLVNVHNKTIGFDGADEIDDTSVKAAYKVMNNYFAGYKTRKGDKKYSHVDAFTSQSKAQADLAQSIASEKQSQIDVINKKKEIKSQRIKLAIGAGCALVFIGGIVLIINQIRK